MSCYFQGCKNKGITKEHIPPKAFFPNGEKEQLLTVKSCADHNNKKSTDDMYVLAHICMNASPSNRARDVFNSSIKPQLEFNNGALRKKLNKGSIKLPNGNVKYDVEMKRLDDFFTALSCGIIYKSCGSSLPKEYKLKHIYFNLGHNLFVELETEKFYKGKPQDFMNFGKPNTRNERIYTVKIFGIPEFKSSITIVHLFFGKFKVISMLSRIIELQ